MADNASILLFIILLPVIGAILNGFVIRNLSARLSGVIASTFVLGAFVASVLSIMRFGSESVKYIAFQWINVGSFQIPFSLEYTPVTAVMLMIVCGIGTLIHIYSIEYMHHDKTPYRFFAYLNLFLAAMLVLVLSGNLVGVFMGWEGVGLCSYLLIGYWYKDKKNAAAGMKAFITNRIGDLGFMVALMLLLRFFGTTEISEILAALKAETFEPWILAAIAFAIFFASTGKSAQIPLYVWLPDAMAGPTPVSALIHAATMVTSGLFIGVRLWPIFEAAPSILTLITWVGISTAYLAALIALTQRDIKKVLAYSTVSQLGFMFAALGLGAPHIALFHVVTHACFKALLFLSAGSVIHGMHEEQDLYKMGGLRKHMPQTHLMYLVGTLAIIGFPLTAGFFSKDMILGAAFERHFLAYFALLGAAVLTAFYMLRSYALAFWGEARSDKARHAHESSSIILGPLFVLAALSIFSGWIQTPAVIGGINKLGRWVGLTIGAEAFGTEHHLSHAAEWLLVLLTTAASLGIAYFSYKVYRAIKSDPGEPRDIWGKLSYNKFYIDEIYLYGPIQLLKSLAQLAYGVIDRYVINGFLHSFRWAFSGASGILSILHTGNVQTYAWYMCLGITLAITILWAVFR